jgi:signal transduction histidine kinase
MRERVALYGGTIAIGSGEQGGFRVHAQLPVQESDAR